MVPLQSKEKGSGVKTPFSVQHHPTCTYCSPLPVGSHLALALDLDLAPTNTSAYSTAPRFDTLYPAATLGLAVLLLPPSSPGGLPSPRRFTFSSFRLSSQPRLASPQTQIQLTHPTQSKAYVWAPASSLVGDIQGAPKLKSCTLSLAHLSFPHCHPLSHPHHTRIFSSPLKHQSLCLLFPFSPSLLNSPQNPLLHTHTTLTPPGRFQHDCAPNTPHYRFPYPNQPPSDFNTIQSQSSQPYYNQHSQRP